MDQLPYEVQGQIFIDYLFTDFLYKYRSVILAQDKGRTHNLGSADPKLRNFLVDFVKCLEPRFYMPGEEFIQDQYEEIFEVVYIMTGAVGVGYRLFDEIFYGVRIVMSGTKKIVSAINDYSCLHNKCSEFLYMPIEPT